MQLQQQQENLDSTVIAVGLNSNNTNDIMTTTTTTDTTASSNDMRNNTATTTTTAATTVITNMATTASTASNGILFSNNSNEGDDDAAAAATSASTRTIQAESNSNNTTATTALPMIKRDDATVGTVTTVEPPNGLRQSSSTVALKNSIRASLSQSIRISQVFCQAVSSAVNGTTGGTAVLSRNDVADLDNAYDSDNANNQQQQQQRRRFNGNNGSTDFDIETGSNDNVDYEYGQQQQRSLRYSIQLDDPIILDEDDDENSKNYDSYRSSQSNQSQTIVTGVSASDRRRLQGQQNHKHQTPSRLFGKQRAANNRGATLNVARREDNAVRKLKLIFILLLVLTAIVAAILVHKFLEDNEQSEFRIQFNYLATQVIEKLQTNAQTKLEAINTLALLIQAYAINTNQSWPFITVPYFEEHIIAMKSLTDAYGVELFPIVTGDKRKAWEQYSVEHADWINASYRTQKILYGKPNRHPVLGQNGTSWFDELWGEQYRNPETPDFDTAGGMSRSIFTTVHPNNKSSHEPYIDPDPNGPYFPQWQAAPMSWYYQTTVNSNYGNFEDFKNCTTISIQNKAACLGVAWTDDNAPGFITTMLYPIFDTFRTDNANVSLSSFEEEPAIANTDTTAGTATSANSSFVSIDHSNVVAFLGVDIYWESYLKDILPNSAKTIYVVVHSTCDQVFTFTLNGTDSKFVTYQEIDDGESGDYHETKYDKYQQTTRFGYKLYEQNIRDPHTNFVTSSYLGSSLYDGFCQYDFTIYPSAELEAQYVTNQPRLYTVVVTVIFAFTIVVFIVYDYLVERRQKLVMRTAVLSDSIVSSLFPSNVKQRLYTEAHQQTIEAKQQNQQQYHQGSSRKDDHSSISTNEPQKTTNHLPLFMMNNRKTSVCSTTSADQSKYEYPSSRTQEGVVAGETTEVDVTTTSDKVNDDDHHHNTRVDPKKTTNTNKTIEDTSTSYSHVSSSGPVTEYRTGYMNNNTITATTSTLCTDSGHGPSFGKLPLAMSPLASVVRRRSIGSNTGSTTGTVIAPASRAIAEKYPDTTVLFADLVGFTKWSSGREPNDVFFLLETIYSSFDSIAARRHVFKIETIGDCYVAVTGLPDPQKDHALIMTRFANDLLHALKFELKNTIGPALGSESVDLAMRVGMHSGSVIAGVLRGDKARFQLFGDTMNTAARMESNGQKNCIHVSQSTADLLIAAGKKHWITPREDMIEAKGKGKMQTYWVNLNRPRQAVRERRNAIKVQFAPRLNRKSIPTDARTANNQVTTKTVPTPLVTSINTERQPLPATPINTEEQSAWHIVASSNFTTDDVSPTSEDDDDDDESVVSHDLAAVAGDAPPMTTALKTTNTTVPKVAGDKLDCISGHSTLTYFTSDSTELGSIDQQSPMRKNDTLLYKGFTPNTGSSNMGDTDKGTAHYDISDTNKESLPNQNQLSNLTEEKDSLKDESSGTQRTSHVQSDYEYR